MTIFDVREVDSDVFAIEHAGLFRINLNSEVMSLGIAEGKVSGNAKVDEWWFVATGREFNARERISRGPVFHKPA